MKRIISCCLALLIVFLCSCQKADNLNSSQQQISIESENATTCYPSPLTTEEKTQKATNIMFAECYGVQLVDGKAMFEFIPIHQFKGEITSTRQMNAITVIGDSEDYDFTNTYSCSNAYLIWVEYDEETGYYRDIVVDDGVHLLNDIDDYQKPRTEQIMEYNYDTVRYVEELLK